MNEFTHIPFLKSGEQIQLILHRHWIVFLFKWLFLLTIFLISFFVLIFSHEFLQIINTSVFWMVLSVFWMVTLSFTYLSWLNDELDLFVITDHRIIGIEQLSVFSRKIAESPLDRIQEVDAEQRGVLQTLFDFGTVNIHTASETSNMTVSIAPSPVENARKINNIIQDFRSKRVVSFDTKKSENPEITPV